jgi:hypothetical protein
MTMTKGETKPRTNPEVKPTEQLREISTIDLESVRGGWDGGVGDPRLKSGIVGPQDNPE